jgi:hypothetical protein
MSASSTDFYGGGLHSKLAVKGVKEKQTNEASSKKWGNEGNGRSERANVIKLGRRTLTGKSLNILEVHKCWRLTGDQIGGKFRHLGDCLFRGIFV